MFCNNDLSNNEVFVKNIVHVLDLFGCFQNWKVKFSCKNLKICNFHFFSKPIVLGNETIIFKTLKMESQHNISHLTNYLLNSTSTLNVKYVLNVI